MCILYVNMDVGIFRFGTRALDICDSVLACRGKEGGAGGAGGARVVGGSRGRAGGMDGWSRWSGLFWNNS